MFELISDKVLLSKGYENFPDFSRKRMLVAYAIGANWRTELEIFDRLVDIGAVPKNAWGLFLVKVILFFGFTVKYDGYFGYYQFEKEKSLPDGTMMYRLYQEFGDDVLY